MDIWVLQGNRAAQDLLSPFGEMNVLSVPNLAELQALGMERAPDVLILALDDLANGIAAIREVRMLRSTRSAGLIAWLSKDDSQFRARLLEAGADDCVMASISGMEMRARITALARRLGASINFGGEEEVTAGSLRMQIASYRVFIQDREIALTLTEFRILEILARKAGGVVRRSDLLTFALKTPHVSSRTIDVHMASLRKKIETDEIKIETVRSMGYRLRA